MDSQLLLALTAVGTLATAVFTGWPVAQRAMDRPRPRWKVVRAVEAESSNDEWGWIRVRFTDVGDGAAYDVETTVLGAEAVGLSRSLSAAARLDSGEAVDLAVKLPLPEGLQHDQYGNWPPYTPTAEILAGIRVRITWNHPPHRWARRRRTYRLGRLEASRAVR